MTNSGCSLYHGDCLEIMKEIPDNSVNCVICDLPYGTTASNWDKRVPIDKLWKEYARVLVSNGTCVLFANGIFTPRVMASNIGDYKYRWVWIKQNSTNFVHAKNRPMVKSEDILVFSKGAMGHASQVKNRMVYNPQGLIRVDRVRKNGKANFTNTLAGKRPSHKDEFLVEYTNYPTDVLFDFPELSPFKKKHPNEKPILLLEYLVKTYTNEGDTVLDNCMGSGTTGIAAIKLKRKFIGIEIEEKYYNISKERMNELVL